MRRPSSLLVFLALLSGQAGAQTLPDAGALMRQTEQMARPKPSPSARREALPPAMPLNDSTALEVKSIHFVGNKQLDQAQLHSVARTFEHRTLRQQDLLQLSHAVSQAYRQTGWLVNVYVPRQNLSEGDLVLQIIETIPPTTTP